MAGTITYESICKCNVLPPYVDIHESKHLKIICEPSVMYNYNIAIPTADTTTFATTYRCTPEKLVPRDAGND